MKLWQMARFDEFFEAQIPEGQEDIPWATTAMISTIARLCDPSSELHIAEDWIRRTAPCDMLLCDEAQINEDRLYRVLDKLLPCKDALQAHLKERWTNLFHATYDLVLYDVTSTYFEGQVLGNPDAQRGHSRDHRGDCKQVCLGLVVTPEGLPLAYEIFPGNTHDSKTVERIVERMEASYGKTNRIWVWDRGMLSAGILPWMREHGRRYVMALPKATLQKHAQLFQDDTLWQTVKNRDVEVRYIMIPDPDSSDRFVLCRSAARVEKEKAMHTRFIDVKRQCHTADVGSLVRKRHSRILDAFFISLLDRAVSVLYVISTDSVDRVRQTRSLIGSSQSAVEPLGEC
jgi:transposase